MKIAIVHDYLREYGGAERVVETLHEMWPKAPVFTSFVDWDALGNQATRFRGWDIRTSPIADNFLIRKFHSPLRFLAPLIWGSIKLNGYDIVISSSGWFMCRGVNIPKPTVHICYIHHPPRNLYGYATGSTLQKYWPVRVYATIINFFLRHYDFTTAQTQAYGTNPMKDFGDGAFGMMSGDGNASSGVTATDKNSVWRTQNGTNGYLMGDFNLSGGITASDKNNHWRVNNGKTTQIP